jgi:hypothetical protein
MSDSTASWLLHFHIMRPSHSLHHLSNSCITCLLLPGPGSRVVLGSDPAEVPATQVVDDAMEYEPAEPVNGPLPSPSQPSAGGPGSTAQQAAVPMLCSPQAPEAGGEPQQQHTRVEEPRQQPQAPPLPPQLRRGTAWCGGSPAAAMWPPRMPKPTDMVIQRSGMFYCASFPPRPGFPAKRGWPQLTI